MSGRKRLYVGVVNSIFRKDSDDSSEESDQFEADLKKNEEQNKNDSTSSADIILNIAYDQFEADLKKKNEEKDKNDTYEDYVRNLNIQNTSTPTTSKHLVPKNLHYLLKNSKKEIERNRFKAMIRLRNKKIPKATLELVADFFYHVEEWPTYVIKALIDKSLDYTNRISLASFFVGNGLRDPEIAIKIYKAYNAAWSPTQLWNIRFNEFGKLFAYLDKPMDDPDRSRIRMNYFYYDMESRRTLYLNGNIRLLGLRS